MELGKLIERRHRHLTLAAPAHQGAPGASGGFFTVIKLALHAPGMRLAKEEKGGLA